MEESSDFPLPLPQKEFRICLVGDVVNDPEVLEAAESLKNALNAEVVEVEHCLEAIESKMVDKWLTLNCLTFFVLKDFTGPVFKRIQEYEFKEDDIKYIIKWILGPPAFKHIATMPHDLSLKKHPLYNYSMAGVVTCITGIHEKTELIELVNRIHFMGGCLRKNMVSKSTHLITRYSSGKKYMYAKTFRLTVVRPDWVDAAWEQRDNAIIATDDTFSQEYKLTLFEGLKICFFGFPAEEHQHMIDVLRTHGGASTELDDPQCSHVVMPNSVGVLSNTERYAKSKLNVFSDVEAKDNSTKMIVDDANVAEAMVVDADINAQIIEKDFFNVDESNIIQGDECVKSELGASIHAADEKNIVVNDADKQEAEYDKKNASDVDGIVLKTEEDDEKFQLNISYISPILASSDSENPMSPEMVDMLDSEKKPKFLRTGSIARKIRYSMNLVADNTPFLKTRQQRRNSLHVDASASESLMDISAVLMPTNVLDATISGKHEDIQNESLKIKVETPLKRILRPRHFLAKKNGKTSTTATDNSSVWRGECKMPTQSSQFESLIYTTQSTDNKRKRRPSRESIGEMYESTKSAAVIGGNTPKSRILRPRRNLTISGLPSSLCKKNFFNETLDKISKKKRGTDKLNQSIKSTQRYEAEDDIDDYDYDDFNDTMDSCQLSILSQSTTSKKQRSFAFTESAGGSVKRTIRRSIHYVSEKTPLSRILRSRRSSITSIDGNDLTPSETFSATERPNKRARMDETSNGVCEFKTPKIPPKILHSSTIKATASTSIAAATTIVVESSSKLPDASAITKAYPNAKSSSSVSKHTNVQENMQVSQNLVGNLVSSHVSSETATTSSLCSLKKSGGSETVVDEHATQAKPNPVNLNTQILKSDWFWYTIQNGYADEKLYRFADYLDSIANTPDTDRRESLPISLNKRKRKRFSQRLQFEGSPLGLGKRRSSISDAVYSSFSDSFLDCTTSPDTSKIYVVEPESSVLESQTPAKKSLRFLHFMDFVNTESNYVGILETIMKLFKIPLEELAEKDDALLNNTEINLIFGKFHSIHEVHQRMLERLRDLQNKWTEDCLIGDIILELKDELIRSYPPYINSFETMKETLVQCDKENPRFHAFLKINQVKPECGRQTLQDLMIRPVQRLPSISLLLNDILKHTGKANPDYAKLEEALKTIKEVMTYINEDKRKTESRVAIFDIFNDIEGCPAHLVSSNRDYISKCEVIELSEELSGRGDALTFYLFSDTIEVCKKRSRGFNSAKSPGTTKMFKHVKLLPLNAIRFVIDISDSQRAFALLCGQDKDKFYSFSIENDVDKIVYLKTLCKQMAEHACRASAEKSLISRTSQELNVDISNVNLSTLDKAFKLAQRTRIKVGRAFSFNKTPSKLKRAVSTMMTSPFGSTNALTPASQLAQMRLASCTNIHEATDEDGSSRSSSPPIVLEMPLSVQPERKHKPSTLNSLGRL